ncbi:MAG: choice-of-anchor J domain-containing protein, partial [Saprospiraceae bacterium]|nr:choice-of-anchor J domain-containing protein [Pyrinomonadaceae bacterium]
MSWIKGLYAKRALMLKASVTSLAIFMFLFLGGVRTANAQAIAEGFESFAALAAAGWSTSNRSQPIGAGAWSQCGGTAIPPAQAGPATSCTLVNFSSGTGTATISNWLITPNRTFNNGDTVSFWTRTANNNFPDRLQLRLSLAGASTNVGTTATDVGDFTQLLVDI